MNVDDYAEDFYMVVRQEEKIDYQHCKLYGVDLVNIIEVVNINLVLKVLILIVVKELKVLMDEMENFNCLLVNRVDVIKNKVL